MFPLSWPKPGQSSLSGCVALKSVRFSGRRRRSSISAATLSCETGRRRPVLPSRPAPQPRQLAGNIHFLPVAVGCMMSRGDRFQILFLEATRGKAKSSLQLEGPQGFPGEPADLGAQPPPRPASCLLPPSLLPSFPRAALSRGSGPQAALQGAAQDVLMDHLQPNEPRSSFRAECAFPPSGLAGSLSPSQNPGPG